VSKPIEFLHEAQIEMTEAALFYDLYRETSAAIIIVAIMHLHRRPGYWQNRL
jgi:hypothetical protein